jgi:tetratricopeptide (TPR) repeat protein
VSDVALLARGPKRSAKAASAETGRGYRYWAFLSYAHEDSKDADRLHRALERFRTPAPLVGQPHPLGEIPARLAPIFRDRQELAASSDLTRTIREALSQSRYFIVLCSPAAAASPWVDQEIRDFKKIHGEDRVLAAIVDGEPFAAERGEDAAECFPPSLRQRVDSRGKLTSRRAEPIAADLRDNADGWRIGQLKLVAGMLGVGLDDLVQREQARRQRRMTWIAAASLAGMAVTSGLAAVAIDARDSARDERREAEGLVEFMLGDLKAKLEPIGKLEALDGVGARILDYYSRQDTTDLDEAGLLQRSRALSLTAQVAYSRGDFDSAERLYRKAMAGTAEAMERDPGNAQYVFDHAQSVFWIGEIERARGRLAEAEAAYREYGRLADRMVEIDPNNPLWRLETVYAAENLGITLLNRRRFDEGARRIFVAFEPMRAVAAANRGNADYQRELNTVLAWMADARRDQGRLKEATALRRRQLAFLDGLLADGTSNVRLEEQQVIARQALALLLDSQGEGDSAITEFRATIAQSERLNQVEPENAIWRASTGRTRLELGATLIRLGRDDEAGREVALGCGITDVLREQAPAGASWRDLQTLCRLNRARLALAAGSFDEAVVLAEQAIESARRETSADPLRPRYRIAAANRVIGDARLRMGDRAGAERAWAAGYSQLPRGVAERPREIADRAELLRRLGRRAEARQLAERLSAMGWKA